MIGRATLYSATAAAIFLLAACDPPGKPPANDPQAENRESIMDFRTLYESNCAGCHGADGKNGPARMLNDAFYLALIPRDTLKGIVINGRPGTAMPAWARSNGGPLTDKQVDALVDGIYTNWSRASSPSSGLLPYTGQPGTADHGKQLFVRDCFMCHGRGAAVGPVTSASYAALVSNQYIRSAILAGRKDLGMPDYRALGMGHPLSDSDVSDLVAYVASFRPASIGSHENENGTGHEGATVKGNEGSGNGPGSPRPQQRNEGNKGQGSSSQQGVK